MVDRNVVVVDNGSRISWFIGGGILVAAIIAGALYFNGYFDRSQTIELKLEVPKVDIK